MARPTGRPAGRPPKLTKALIDKIAECFLVAFTDEQTALYCGINEKTIRRLRAGGLCPAVKLAELEREKQYRLRVWNSETFWQGAAWFLERKYPTQFARPEIQLSFNNSYTQNNLSISISGSEAKEIEKDAKPVREKIEHMFKAYRPELNTDNSSLITDHE